MQSASDMFRFYILTEQRNGLSASEAVQKRNLDWLDEAPLRATIFGSTRILLLVLKHHCHASIPGRPCSVHTKGKIQ